MEMKVKRKRDEGTKENKENRRKEMMKEEEICFSPL